MRDSSATSRSLIVVFFTQRHPQTKTSITERNDGLTDGTKSRSRGDLEVFKGFISSALQSLSLTAMHTKTNVSCGKVASKNIPLPENLDQKKHGWYDNWREAITLDVDLSYSYILVLHWSKFQCYVHRTSLKYRESLEKWICVLAISIPITQTRLFCQMQANSFWAEFQV